MRVAESYQNTTLILCSSRHTCTLLHRSVFRHIHFAHLPRPQYALPPPMNRSTGCLTPSNTRVFTSEELEGEHSPRHHSFETSKWRAAILLREPLQRDCRADRERGHVPEGTFLLFPQAVLPALAVHSLSFTTTAWPHAVFPTLSIGVGMYSSQAFKSCKALTHTCR